MAGHYFYDPRPFYGHNGSNGLMPLDELFYGRYEPVPYWMDQRIAPVSAFDDYYPGHKKMATWRAPEVQHYAYKRPEVRDDIYTDMYKRSPYNFNGSNGVAAPIGFGAHPEMRQQQGQTQDDTWVHTMTPHANSLHGHGQPHGNMIRNGNGSGNEQYRQMDAPMGYMPNGNNGNRQMEIPMNGHVSNKGNNMGSNGNHGNKQMGVKGNQFGNGYNAFENVKSSQGQGGHGGLKSMNSKQGSGNKAQRYAQDDSSSDDSDDEYENGNKNGVKWATKNSIKHGNSHQSHTQKTGSAHHKGDNYGYDSNSRGISSQHMSSMKSGGQGGKSGGSHGSNHSKVSKLLRFQTGGDSSSSDSEDESYGHSNKGSKSSKSSKGQHMQGSAKMSNQHGNHGFQSYGQQQGKQMQYGSQSKGVELKVPICCDNCERKVRACLEYMDGVESVLCDQWNRKVIVYGNVKAENVLKRVRRVKKTSELWQQAKQQQQLRY